MVRQRALPVGVCELVAVPSVRPRAARSRDGRRPPGRPRPVTAPVLARHPAPCVRPGRQVGSLVALGVAFCLAVLAFGLLSNVGSGRPDPAPAQTTVVHVAGGETLWELAGRVAPGGDRTTVVRQIQRLNGLEGAELRAGQLLRVPLSVARS
ncbi:hypothetical protein GCM10012275_36280 [Longimycelium tulufanense]|uniref:LysM domain-containing protein n=1 Tax=Longimycelium tulufanense TaxID=907463 RepID=A0A8J3FXG2_9PSEU|nr:LysM peptidoglycan-binding domain-containing protein [Longimycelium tulufanense]GGM62277.1 hypothetical protein GCM10012275_36280 [Longimycelium tulufanense]